MGLRWIKGSGLQRLDEDANLVEQTLDAVKLDLVFDPGYGIKCVDKYGSCLIVGDPQDRKILLSDPANRLNPRFLALAKSDTLQDVKLYQQQHATLPGAAGAIRGRLKLEIVPGDDNAGQDAPWALVTASYVPHDTLLAETFVAQADARGEFVIDLAGMRWPDDDSKPQFTLAITSLEGIDPEEAADPDLFGDFNISTDGTAGTLQAGFTVTLDNYGEVRKLGNLLVAPD
ncbi:MAG: hypothetical protein P8Z31_07960 [Gammaproteobacteria bacterium]